MKPRLPIPPTPPRGSSLSIPLLLAPPPPPPSHPYSASSGRPQPSPPDASRRTSGADPHTLKSFALTPPHPAPAPRRATLRLARALPGGPASNSPGAPASATPPSPPFLQRLAPDADALHCDGLPPCEAAAPRRPAPREVF
ncbi:hypothetical protein ACP4OV_022536 [Aristida adscensionis]